VTLELAVPREIGPGDRWDGEVGAIRLVYGEGRLAELGEEARRLGARRALLVTDPGVREAGHATLAESSLTAADIAFTTFSEIDSEPTTEHVDAGLRAVRQGAAPDLLIAVGGGSAMDTAKGINFLLTQGGRMEDFWGFGKATRPLLPSLGVPTTAGTGSDAQSYALISQLGTGRKMACGDPGARFRTVILDPLLTATVPKPVAGRAALDALSHAVESFVTKKRNAPSNALALRAWRWLEAAFELSLTADATAEVRGRMLLGAHLAGAAIEASMLGAAHAAANPLTARHRIPHGEAIALMLPGVVRFNGGAVDALYRELDPAGAEGVARRIEALRRAAGLAERLRDRQVPADSLGALAGLASKEWTGGFNPRPVTVEDFQELYEAAY
jgi:alcohol dehydrogenase class IV